MAIEILQRSAFSIVGMSLRTRPMSPDIPALWPKFVAREDEIEGKTETNVTYGAMLHEPPDSLLYIAAVAVDPGTPAPAGLENRDIPAGTYARFQYPLGRLGEGFAEIFNRLLPSLRYVQAPGFMLERYDEKFCPDNPESLVEIFIPVRAR
jgi:AraC family transcriptional regulator